VYGGTSAFIRTKRVFEFPVFVSRIFLTLIALAINHHIVREMAITEFVLSRASAEPNSRREQLARAAARLFAERGYHGVTIEEISSAVGISGPGLYKHFSSKDAVLAEMLVSISRHLLEEGQREVRSATTCNEALDRLLTFHIDFALTCPDLIRVQDRDLSNLSPGEARNVRHLQRSYVELWVDVFIKIDADLDRTEARTRAHAIFGLINSTSHSSNGQDSEMHGNILLKMAKGAMGIFA
jgi:AcrR family transcriptional regulator